MLNTKNKRLTAVEKVLFLLVIISSITFQINAFADTKELTAENYRVSGYEEHQKGNLKEALSYYAKAITLGLHNAVVLNDMGVLYEQVNLPVKAERSYLKAIEVDRQYLPPYLNLGYFYLSRGNKEKAFKFLKVRYEQAELGDPWAAKAKDELIAIHPGYRQVVDRIEAQRLASEIEKNIQDEFVRKIEESQSHFQAGRRLAKQGDHSQAIYQYDQALKLTPNNRLVLEARKSAVTEIAKENVKKHSDLAIQMLNAGDSQSAKREFQKLLTVIPNE